MRFKKQEKRKDPIWANPKVITIKHPSINERKMLEEKLRPLPDTPEGNLIRAAARLRFNQNWHAKTMEYGFLNEARKQQNQIDNILENIFKE